MRQMIQEHQQQEMIQMPPQIHQQEVHSIQQVVTVDQTIPEIVEQVTISQIEDQ